MKKSLIVASLLFAGTSVMASDYFVGFDVGKSKGTATAYYQGFSEKSSGDRKHSLSIKGGKTLDNYRIYGKYTDVDKNDGSSMAITGHYDKFLTTNGTVKPYIGGAFGYLNYSTDDDYVDISGLTYGVTLGVVADISKQISFEIGYDYMLTNGSDTLDNGVEVESDKYDNFRVGINIKF